MNFNEDKSDENVDSFIPKELNSKVTEFYSTLQTLDYQTLIVLCVMVSILCLIFLRSCWKCCCTKNASDVGTKKKNDTEDEVDIEGGMADSESWGSWSPKPSQSNGVKTKLNLSAAGQAKRKARIKKIRAREQRETGFSNSRNRATVRKQSSRNATAADMFASLGMSAKYTGSKRINANSISAKPFSAKSSRFKVDSSTSAQGNSQDVGWYPADDLSDEELLNLN
eukprot:g4413.t1